MRYNLTLEKFCKLNLRLFLIQILDYDFLSGISIYNGNTVHNAGENPTYGRCIL